MTFYALSALINGLTSSALGIIVYFKNKKGTVNRSYGITTICIGIWSYSYFFWQISPLEREALFWCRVLMVGAIYLPPAYLHFILSFLGLDKKKSKLIVTNYAISTIFFILNFTPLFVKGVTPKLVFKFWPDAGVSYLPFLILTYSNCIIYAIFVMIKEFTNSSTTAIKRAQLRYVILGGILGFGGGATNYPLWYNIPILPVGNIMVSVGIGFMAYAIARYRLMDIKIALTRAGIFIVVYTLILGIPFWVGFRFLGQGLWILPVAVTGLLATFGPFLYIYIDRKAEERLFKEQKRYQQTLRQASMGMTRIRNLTRLLDLIAHVVTKTVRITYVGIYLLNEEANEYVLQVCRDKGRTPVDKLSADNPLISWIAKHRKPLVHDELKRQLEDLKEATYEPIVATMQMLTCSVVVPSFLEDKLLGFIVLGEKASGHIYTNEDLGVFEVLASQAALAIENARFFEETKQMQEQIAQAEKMATVGTMADGLSHQINNRFYALLLIAGNTIDTIKEIDTSKTSPEMQEMFKEVNHALERIKDNVVQGGEVVKGLLKYTRKSDEGFEELTLDKILDDALSMAQYKIKLPEFDIVREYTKELPRIRGNAVQLQEVFFNFFDNAYDAIVERRTFLKEEGYRGKIVISAQANGKFVSVSFADNGMGIKHESLKKMFTPFFTTKTSARKGTGLGLYVIKRIVEDFHKGTIAFESIHHFGTTFTLQLPMAT